MKKEKGFSLIELLIVISVIIGIAVGVFYIYKKVSFGMKTNETIKELTSIQNQIINVAETSGFDTHNKSYLFGHLYFPLELIETKLPERYPRRLTLNSMRLVSPFGGDFSVNLMTHNDTLYSISYSIEMPEFDVESCVKIMTSQINNVYNSKLTSMSLGSNALGGTGNLLQFDDKGNLLQNKSTLIKDITDTCSKFEKPKEMHLWFQYTYR